MNKTYSLTILGYPASKMDEISSCFSMMTYGLTQAFKKLSNVQLIEQNIIENYSPLTKYFSATLPNYQLEKLIPVDYIVAINYCAFFNRPGTLDALHTKCKKVVSFLEVPALADFCYVFRHTYDKIPKEKQRLLPPIYFPELTQDIKKEPNSILLDHLCLYWYGNKEREWSLRIWDWLKEIKDRYKIYCLVDADVQYGNKGNPKLTQMQLLPDYITPIYATNFLDYMNQTAKMETFIVTHQGSYNFSVVDMAYRGSRILAPYHFVPKVNEDLFVIEKFGNKNDLIEIIKQSYYYQNHYMRCIPFDSVAHLMNEDFEQWLQ